MIADGVRFLTVDVRGNCLRAVVSVGQSSSEPHDARIGMLVPLV